MRAAGTLLAVCMVAACSGQPATHQAQPSPQASAHAHGSGRAHGVFAAFEPARHDELLVVDAVTGRVLRTVRAPSSEGYAADLRRGLWYLPVFVAASCRTAMDRVRVGNVQSDQGQVTKLAVVDGGPVDSVDTQPALSPGGRELAVVLDTGPTLKDSGVGARTCGSTDIIAVLDTHTGSVRYLTGRAGDQVQDLVWDQHKLVASVTRFPHVTGVVEEFDPSRATTYTGGRVILRERRGQPGPVFRWRDCMAVITEGTIGCIHNGQILLSHSDRPQSGLPDSVDRVSASDHGTELLLQKGNGTTYTWRDGIRHAIPVTVRGHWDEPTW
jgi:hypothetical protein